VDRDAGAPLVGHLLWPPDYRQALGGKVEKKIRGGLGLSAGTEYTIAAKRWR